LAAKLWLVTLLALIPLAVAIAFTVRLAATRNGAWYCCDEAEGVEPSSE
jgi:hypothetical protein